MNIFMIYPSQGNMISPYYGLASIISVLKQAKHSVKLLIIDDEVKIKDVVRSISEFSTDIVGISCMSNYWQYVKELSREIKASFEIPIFVGGPHAIVCPLSFQETKNIDGFCIGEGEYAFLEVVNKIGEGMDFRGTTNFYFKDSENKIIKNERRLMISNLDDLPFPDKDTFPKKAFMNYANFIFSRGCPFSCSYCCNSAFHEIFKGKAIRYRSAGSAIKEIEVFLKKYKVGLLSFDDDCFNKNPKWFKEFCLEYKERIKIPFACNTRPELLNRESAKLLKEAGCKRVNIGVESGDEGLRRTVLNRNIKDSDIIRAFDCAKEFGLETMSFNMVGFPGETKASIRKTIELNKRIKPTYAQITVFYPYAGSPLGKLCKEKGYIEDEARLYSFFEGDSILKIPNLSKKDIKNLFFRFNLEVNDKNLIVHITKRIKHIFYSWYRHTPLFMKNILRELKQWGC